MFSKINTKEILKSIAVYFVLFLITIMLVCGFLYLSADETYGDYISILAGSDHFLGSANGIKQMNNKIKEINIDPEQRYLLLGDSVANQIFQDELWEDYNPLLCDLASNQATTIVGQYMLLRAFLDTHEAVDDVWVMCGMDSYSFRFYDPKLGYTYLVAPFANNDLYTYLDPEDWEELGQAAGYPFGNVNVAKFLCKSEVCLRWYLESVKDKDQPHLQNNLGYKYLDRMNQLCIERGINFHILIAPTPNPTPEEFLHDADKILRGMADAEGLDYGDNIWSLVKEMDYSDVMKDTSTFNKFSYALLHTPFCPPEIFKDGSHFDEDHESYEYLMNGVKSWYSYDSISDILCQS